MPNAYTYPSAYTYNGGISYPYNLDQNTKDQMVAYNKLMIASYQNGQQLYSNSQYPTLSPTQQQAFSNSINSSNVFPNNQHETRNNAEKIAGDNTKNEESPTNSNSSSFLGASNESHTTTLSSNMLPSPTVNVSNMQDTSSSSATTSSTNPCQPSPQDNRLQETTNMSQQLSPSNLQQYSPTNSFNNWPANNFPYTADNPYAAFYNNANAAAAVMYNQSMNMGVNPQTYFAGGGSQQQPDSTTSANLNRGWGQHPANATNTYPFHPAAFVSPYSDPTAAALYSNYANLWNTHHNTGQYIYGNTLQQQQNNPNGFMNNLSTEKMRENCDKQISNHAIPQNTHQLKSFYNESHPTQPSHYDKSQMATSTTLHDQTNHGINSQSTFSSITSSPNQSIDLELTYRNNPELAEKLRQVSLKKPRVTFSIKQVVELEKEFHSSR